MSHQNHEFGRFHRPRLLGLSLDNVVLSITGTFIIPDSSPTVWVMNGGLGDRAVRLPTLSTDRQVVLANVGTTNKLSVTDSNGVALVDIPTSAVGMFFAGTSRWVWFTDSLASDLIPITDVVASGPVLPTDLIVHVNGAGAVVLTLPTSASWLATSGWRGLPLEIADISNAASTNNITINPAGVETIGGNASLTINADSGSYQLRPKTAGGWTFR